MPSPQELLLATDELIALDAELGAVTTSLAGLPATPLEADLPTIVAIISDLNTIATTLNTTVTSALQAISKTRINQ